MTFDQIHYAILVGVALAIALAGGGFLIGMLSKAKIEKLTVEFNGKEEKEK